MTPPAWLDASGRRRPTLACWTCAATLVALAWIQVGCATTPPSSEPLNPVSVLPGVWEGRIPEWDSVPWRLQVASIQEKGTDIWIGRARFGPGGQQFVN